MLRSLMLLQKNKWSSVLDVYSNLENIEPEAFRDETNAFQSASVLCSDPELSAL